MVAVNITFPADIDLPSSGEPHVFNVTTYGADPTGVNSSHQAFQDAINAAKAVNLGPGYGAWASQRSGTVLIPKGLYRGIGSLDCTNCVGLTIRGQGTWGAAIYADGQTTAAPVFDFAQSSYCQVNDLGIYGQNPSTGGAPSVIPNSGLFFSDTSAAPGSSNKNTVRGVNIFGHWAGAAMSFYRTTNNNIFDCALHNDNVNGGTLYVGIHNNQLPVVSLYRTLAGSGFAANEIAFFGCEFHGAKTPGANLAPVWLSGTETVSFHGGVIDSNGINQPFVYFPTSNTRPLFHAGKFYKEAPTGNPGSIFFAQTGAVVDKLWATHWKHSAVAGLPNTAGPGSFTNIDLNGM